jgi:hypothetical protein
MRRAEKMHVVDAIASLDEKQQRLFACDCAEHVLHLFEQEYPEDKRPRNAIEVSRQYAEGQANLHQLKEASESAKSASHYAIQVSGRPISINAAAHAARSAQWAAWDTTGLVHLNPVGFVDMTQFDASFAASYNARQAAGIALLAGKNDKHNRIVKRRKAYEQALQTASAAEREWQLERAQWYTDTEASDAR